jgi:hypothetical protein
MNIWFYKETLSYFSFANKRKYKSKCLWKVMNIKNKIPIHANLGLIFLEFLIGNYISVFTNIGSKGSFMYYLSSYPIIAIHAMLGGLIFIISLVLIGLTFKSGKRLFYGSIIGFLGVLLAVIGGYEYLMSGLIGSFSFLMALGFLIAISGYIMALLEN